MRCYSYIDQAPPTPLPAPPSLPPVRRRDAGGTFVDGALSGYNNPSLLVLTEGLDFAAGREIDLMVSLGCGDPDGVAEGTVPTSLAFWFGQARGRPRLRRPGACWQLQPVARHARRSLEAPPRGGDARSLLPGASGAVAPLPRRPCVFLSSLSAADTFVRCCPPSPFSPPLPSTLGTPSLQIYNLAFDARLQEDRTLRLLRRISPETRYMRLSPPTGYVALTEHRDKALAEMKADCLAFMAAR